MTHALTCRLAVPAALAALAVASTAAQATDVDLPGNVRVSYDQATFTGSTSGFGVLDPTTFNVTTTATGVQLGFNDQMTAFANSLTTFSIDTQTGSFAASIVFTALPGYMITGYTITYAGTYSIETPGYVEAGGPGGSFFASSSAGINAPFSYMGMVSGAVAPALDGSISATADVQVLLVQTGTEVVQVGTTFEEQCSIPGDPGSCTLVEVPVFEERPVFMEQSDFGDASINLQSVKIEANVAAVPEPGTYALMFAGLAALACVARRRRSAAAECHGAPRPVSGRLPQDWLA